ncbi:fumarylacetoacetase [Pseudorhodobacter sp. MZDSW-24AT]|uniref:fumarylacetoacetase n=1 Tax=Pseudorhodobacter sp. MZDSW-24AT TaxID=2052957 RepID=UPI000C1DE1C1|nr:fumarylacetoacetase [Pseudorhodobacter sp. MZDSW-24AT]PJF09294.1 fumarylacetoacetase [Pseudorhodobacter sp. MZDSW-24AT]
MTQSWVKGANRPDCDFSLGNLPYGVFEANGNTPRCGIAIGDMILDLSELVFAGKLVAENCGFDRPALNTFMAAGPNTWEAVRNRVTELLAENGSTDLRDDAALCHRALVPQSSAQMHLPIEVKGYTDFYAGRQHAFNSGSILRGPENALPPNWSHMPIGYNGRASTVVVSGTPVRRPLGQTLPPGGDSPVIGPSRRLDIEVEFGAIVGISTELGQTLTLAEAWEHLFGFVLLNDWSARDIQRWEGQPLGPFQSKAFATSISPWVVTRAALEACRRSAPARDKALLPYLHETAPYFFDITLEAHLKPADADRASRIVQCNTTQLTYSAPQLLAHHALCGCRMQTGDLLGSGTISGPERHNFGCLMEQSWGGRDEIALEHGGSRKFLEDGDSVTLTGWGMANGNRIGFGRCEGQILPAHAEVGKGA